jgi:hypothetical protein
LNGFFLAGLDRADDPAVQPADDFLLFERLHADRDHHAIAKQRDNPMLAGVKRQRNGRQHVVTLKAGGLDPVAEQERPDGDAAFAHRGGIAHRSVAG